ncbi:MAG TPA: Gfo/Idh/MocA family oxidoreductase [Candidatus Baltobacteraceae bacterium]|jgi:predicted dehydrogenase|nr:Gfo/Idh/MocA family oxidoreductase [Candidatus Baltobacteraceae bacterium]
MNSVRLGIIGMGNIGSHHAAYLLEGKVKRVELRAVSDAFADKLAQYEQRGLKVFADGGELIRSGEVDAVIIATPHYQHTSLGIAALKAGLHIMVEKPISAHKADAERLIAVRRQFPKQVFAAMFQMRTESRYAKIKKLIAEGQLGQVVRLTWIMTDWFRSEAYYASGGWRATWKGEGGGVLINQCLHQLDMLQWLLGMPARVRSFVQLGRFHNIEVEDNVTAYMEFPNGGAGTFISTTGEAPGTSRLELAGEMGKVLLENDALLFFRNEVSMFQHSKTSRLGFQKPEAWKIEIPITSEPAQHAALTQNFIDAILDGVPLIAPGEEGIHSIELANVILYSGLMERTIELPLDGAAYEKKLNELIAASKFEKKVAPVSNEDFTGSFRR